MEPNQSKGTISTEEQKLPSPMPSENQTTDASPAEPKQGQAEGKGEDDLMLPENASERTREQFEKLKARLKEKEEALAKASTTPKPEPEFDSVLDEFRLPPNVQQTMPPVVETPNVSQQQVADIQRRFIDAEGNVDINGLNNALLQAEANAKKAEQMAYKTQEQLAKIEETRQVKEAHQAHPEIDPRSDKFDKKLYGLVRDRLLRNMYQGKNISLVDTVAEVKTDIGVQVKPDEVAQKAVSEYKEKQERRNQGPFEPGRGAGRDTASDAEDLRSRTMRGDSSAVAERLKKLGI